MPEPHNSIGDADMIQGLFLEIAKALVDQPEALRIESLPDGEGVVLRLKVAQNDLGKVIGKQGRTARSLRTILAASSMKNHVLFSLDIQTE